jgi:hypothetical protein
MRDTWQGECAWTADEAVTPVSDPLAEELSRGEECARFIGELPRPAPLPAKDLALLRLKAGFGETTLRRARKLLGVKAVRNSLGMWEAVLPKTVQTNPTQKR